MTPDNNRIYLTNINTLASLREGKKTESTKCIYSSYW